jgi:hypothetical protein
MATGTRARHPDLVPEITRVAGARDVDAHALDARSRRPEVSQPIDVGVAARTKHARRKRALHRERGERFRGVVDAHVHARCVQRQPTKSGLGRRPPETLLLEPRDSAVVDDEPLLVAPRCVVDLPGVHRFDIAGDDAVHQPRGIAPLDDVLEQR